MGENVRHGENDPNERSNFVQFFRAPICLSPSWLPSLGTAGRKSLPTNELWAFRFTGAFR